ncbi:MAG: S8 family serine peptidase [Candidatus Aegiribacteria sp.]|nr:S8 family serine peptidase [Candidatus Aegiribacteria sp.]MBD3294821.1 S8 family serine peptidase [Candidatus Fermentibacteria bacterium]
MKPLFLLCLSCTLTLNAYGERPAAWWVFLSDRGPGLDSRLKARTEELRNSPSWERRIESGVSEATPLDLEPWDGYIERIASAPVCVDVRTESRFLNAVSIEASGDPGSLMELPFVSHLQPVSSSTFRRPDFEGAYGSALDMTSDQLQQINLDMLHYRGWNGGGIIVGILDSGFNLDHEVFTSTSIMDMYDFVSGDPDPSQQPGDPDGQADHGTAVLSIMGGYSAGLFTGGAPGAWYLLAKTEDIGDEYQAEEDYWVEGLEWADSSGAHLVNSSLGYIDWYDYSDLDGNTAVTTVAADAAASRGMLVFNSIGNDGPAEGTLIAPADGDSVFAVGAVDAFGQVTDFSSRGPTYDDRVKPDAVCLGKAVTLAYQGTSVYSSGNGTSFASPLAASAAAALKQAHPEWNMLEIMEVLLQTASVSSNPDNSMGHGIIDSYEALLYRSVTGSVRYSADLQYAAEYPLEIVMDDTVYSTSTNEAGWFAFSPDENGQFIVQDGGGNGELIPVAGVLDDEGVELELYADRSPSASPVSVYPVPSTGDVYIGFDLVDGPVNVTLTIYDLTGSLVHSETRENIGPGCFRAPIQGEAFHWDGNCLNGGSASSGIYIILLKEGDTSRLLKCSLVR